MLTLSDTRLNWISKNISWRHQKIFQQENVVFVYIEIVESHDLTSKVAQSPQKKARSLQKWQSQFQCLGGEANGRSLNRTSVNCFFSKNCQCTLKNNWALWPWGREGKNLELVRDENMIFGKKEFWPRSCKRSKTWFKSLFFWFDGEVSWLAVEVLSQCLK